MAVKSHATERDVPQETNKPAHPDLGWPARSVSGQARIHPNQLGLVLSCRFFDTPLHGPSEGLDWVAVVVSKKVGMVWVSGGGL